jgi:hypothetical protein
MKTAVWVIASCSIVEVDRRFRGAYYLHRFSSMMEAVRASEMQVRFYEATGHYFPEGCLSSLRIQSEKKTLICKESEVVRLKLFSGK